MPARPWATISPSRLSSCQLCFFHSRQALDCKLKQFRGAFHHVWTYPSFYDIFQLLCIGIWGWGKRWPLACWVGRSCGGAWGCPLWLLQPLCPESGLKGQEGGHDLGYSFHIGFKFLSIYPKNEALYDNRVWAASPLHLQGLLLQAPLCLKKVMGKCTGCWSWQCACVHV